MNTNDIPVSSLFNDIPEYRINAALMSGTISAAIINKRHSMNLSQKEFAKKFGVSQGMVSKWESAEYNFTISNLAEVLSKLEIPYDLIIDNKIAIHKHKRSIVSVSSELTHQWSSKIHLDAFSKTEGAA